MPRGAASDPQGQFLARLRARERYEPPPRSRGPEKLAGVRRLLERVGSPERAYRVVHVAGTNGKGTTAAMIAGLLSSGGHKVGLYTSPHLTDVRERIAIGGAPIAPDMFRRAGGRVLDAAEVVERESYLSYFDVMTAIGLEAFREAGVEWAVLETGLGGASDATNVTAKELCVITRIGLDHMAVLGPDLRAIAAQKLGIIRPEVPVVIAAQEEGLGAWLEAEARRGGARPVAAPELVAEELGAGQLRIPWPEGGSAILAGPEAGLPAARLEAAASALAAGELLLGPAERAERMERLLHCLNTPVPGRLDVRRAVRVRHAEAPPIALTVLDGGHNANALLALNGLLTRMGIEHATLILAMQRDKLVSPVLAPLGDLLRRAGELLTIAPATPRAPAPDELDGFLKQALGNRALAPPLTVCADVRAALLRAATHPERPLVVAGSLWMVGDAIAQLEPSVPAPSWREASDAPARAP